MIPNYLYILSCGLFSLFCAILKKLHDVKYYPKNIYTFIVDVLLSSVSGLLIAMTLLDFVESKILLMGLSGLGGMFGVSALKILMCKKLNKKIKIHIDLGDDKDISDLLKKKE